jgi:hypothetical protein
MGRPFIQVNRLCQRKGAGRSEQRHSRPMYRISLCTVVHTSSTCLEVTIPDFAFGVKL